MPSFDVLVNYDAIEEDGTFTLKKGQFGWSGEASDSTDAEKKARAAAIQEGYRTLTVLPSNITEYPRD